MNQNNINKWNEKYTYSISEQQKIDMELLKNNIPDCVKVAKTGPGFDMLGVDYIATLTGGAQIYIDAKTRMPGCSKWWKNGEPDLALELWSDIDAKKDGWTLSTTTPVDFILYTFDGSDWDKSYLISFQLLRAALIKNMDLWIKTYRTKKQTSSNSYGDVWYGEAMFIPVSVVLAAVNQTKIIQVS